MFLILLLIKSNKHLRSSVRNHAGVPKERTSFRAFTRPLALTFLSQRGANPSRCAATNEGLPRSGSGGVSMALVSDACKHIQTFSAPCMNDVLGIRIFNFIPNSYLYKLWYYELFEILEFVLDV